VIGPPDGPSVASRGALRQGAICPHPTIWDRPVLRFRDRAAGRAHDMVEAKNRYPPEEQSGCCHVLVRLGAPMWQQFQSLVQKVDEHLPPIVVDAGLVMIATVLITVLVRSIVV
jgi:hypothetical protein